MKLLLDTHAFLFAISQSNQLTARGRAMLANPKVERWLSAVSLWEIAGKVQTGKLSLPLDRHFYSHHLGALQARVLGVELRHSFALLELRRAIAIRSTGY